MARSAVLSIPPAADALEAKPERLKPLEPRTARPGGLGRAVRFGRCPWRLLADCLPEPGISQMQVPGRVADLGMVRTGDPACTDVRVAPRPILALQPVRIGGSAYYDSGTAIPTRAGLGTAARGPACRLCAVNASGT